MPRKSAFVDEIATGGAFSHEKNLVVLVDLTD